MGLKKNTLREAQARAGRIYIDWQAFYNQARQRHKTLKSARGAANAVIAKKYNLTPREIQIIRKKGGQVRKTSADLAVVKSKKLEAQTRTFRQLHGAVEDAVSVLRTPAYEDLLESCALLPSKKMPCAMLAFSSEEAATKADSLQVLTAVLARALLRAHELHEKEVSGYSQRAPAKRK